MCRSIKTLRTGATPAGDDEITAAALQYVRKISGYTRPSRANAEAFERAVDAVHGPRHDDADGAELEQHAQQQQQVERPRRVGEHLLYRWPDRPSRGPWEAWAVLSAVAAVTSRVQLGPLVTPTGFHNPALLAKIASTVDVMSNGRLLCGIGAGWYEHEWRAYGYGFPEVPVRAGRSTRRDGRIGR